MEPKMPDSKREEDIFTHRFGIEFFSADVGFNPVTELGLSIQRGSG